MREEVICVFRRGHDEHWPPGADNEKPANGKRLTITQRTSLGQ